MATESFIERFYRVKAELEKNSNYGKTREEIIDNPSNRAIRNYERKYGKIGKKSFEDELLEARIKSARKGAQDKTYYSPLPLSNEAHEELNKQLNKDTPQGTIDRLSARKIDVYKDAQAVKAARPYINQENNEKAARFDELAKRYEDSAAQKLAEAQRKQNYLTSEELAKKNIYAAAEADEHIAQVYRDKAEAVRKGEYVEGADDYVPKTQEQKKKEFAAMSRAQRDDKLTELRYNVQYWQEEKDNKDTKYAQAVIDSKIKESEDELKAYTSIAEAANENDELEQQKAWQKSLIELGSEKLRGLREVARRNLDKAKVNLVAAQNAELGGTGTTLDRSQKQQAVDHYEEMLSKIDNALYYADQNEKKSVYDALRYNNDFKSVSLAGKSLKDEAPEKVIDKIQSGNSSSDTWVGPTNIKNKAVFARNLKEEYGKLYQNSELHGDVFNELPELNVLEPYSYMTDDEVDTYSYILLKEGLEAADTYFSVIEDDIDERRREQLKKEARQYAEQDPVGATVETVFMNILSSPGALASTISNDIANIGADIKKPNDMNSVAFSNTAAVSEIRGTVQEDMSDVGRFFYGTATSAADNLAQAALFGKFMPVVMGTTAATSTYYDLKEQGIDDAKAQGVAMLSGVFELAFEKIGTAPIFDMLDNKAANFEGAWQFIKQNVLSEFGEEAATEVANIVTNAIFLGKDSEWAQRLREYKLQGMTDAEAIAKVLGEYGLQVLEAGVAGGLTGGALGGISTAINTEYVGQQMSAEDVISISLQSLVRSKNGKIAQMAQDVSDSLDGKGVTSSQANELAQLAMSSKDLETQLTGQDLSQKLMKDLSAKKEVNVDQYAVALTNSKDEAVRNLALKYTGLELNVISEIDELARLETNSSVRQAAKLLKKTVTGKASTAFERGTAYNNLQAMMAKEQQRPQSDMPLENTAMEQSQPTNHDVQAQFDGEQNNNQEYLSDSELDDYLRTGAKANKRKLEAFIKGENLIIRNRAELEEYVDASIKGEKRPTVAYGRVSDRLAKDVLGYSEGKIDISGSYLELVPQYLKDAYDIYSKTINRINIPLDIEDFYSLADYIDNYDELIFATSKSKENNSLAVSKKIGDKWIVIEYKISKRRNAIQLGTMQGMTEQRYGEYIKKYRKERLQYAADAIIPMPYVQDEHTPNEPLFTNSIFKGEGNVNSSSVENDAKKENLAVAADEQASANTSETHVSTVLFDPNISQKDTFSKHIDDIVLDVNDKNYDVYISKTTDTIVNVGLPQGPLLMRNSKVKEILKKHDEMSIDLIKRIPESLNDPMLILKSKTHETESIVVVTDIETKKGNMIIPIWLNQKGTYIDLKQGKTINKNVNFVATAYGRNIRGLVEYAIDNDGILYVNSDTKKVRQLFAQNGLQLPTPLKLSNFNNNISQKDIFVNNSIRTKSEKDTKHARKKKALSAEGIITAFNLAPGEIREAIAIANDKKTTAAIPKIYNFEGTSRLSEYFKLYPDSMSAFMDEYNTDIIKSDVKNSPNIEMDKEKIGKMLDEAKALKTINRLEKKVTTAENKLVTQREKQRDVSNRKKETEKRRKGIENIKKNVNDLATRLLKPTDKKHMPEPLSKIARALIDLIEFDGSQWETNEGNMWRIKKEKLDQAIGIAQKINTESDDYFFFDPAFASRLEALREMIGEKAYLSDKNLAEIEEIDSIVNSFKKMVAEMDQSHALRRKEDISEISEQIIEHLENKKNYNYVQRNAINYGFMDAFLFLDELGPGGTLLANSLSDALDKHGRNLNKIAGFREAVVDEATIRKLKDTKQVVELSSGKYEFTKPQLMELYELFKRDVAKERLLNGGIAIPNTQRLEKDKVTRIKLKDTDALTISNALSDSEKRIADKLQKYMATSGSELGNEVSLELYGYKRFRSGGDYYTMKAEEGTYNVSDKSVNEGSGNYGLYYLKNSGFTKQVTENTQNSGKVVNTLMLGDVFDTFSDHMGRMAAYNAWVPLLTDVMRIFNYKNAETDTILRRTMNDTMGKNASDFFTELIKAINGIGHKESFRFKIFDKLYKNAKIAAVGANIRVIAQQPISYIRAAYMIDPKYLAEAAIKDADIGSKNEKIDRMHEYAPITLWKEWGRSDISTGRTARAIILGDISATERIQDATMWGASKADDMTWRRIWNACLLETLDKTDLKPYSEEFYRHTGHRFTDIINRTQVVDTPLHRAQMMRSTSDIVKMETQFKSENIKTLNMFRMAAREFRVSQKAGWGKFSRAMAVTAVNALGLAVVQSLIDALRDAIDRDEEGNKRDYWDKFSDKYWENFFGNINLLEQTPFVGTIWNLISNTYTDNTPLYLKGLKKALDVYHELDAAILGEKDLDVYDLIYTASEAVSSITGIAFSNVFRDAKAFFNTLVPEGKKITDTYYKDHHTQEDTAREIVNLFMVGYEDVLKKDTPPKTMTDHDGNEITLTKEQKQNYRDSYNITYGTIANMLNDLDIWEKLPEKQRASAYEAVKRKAAQEAKYAIIGYPKDEYGDEQRTSMEEYAEDCIYYGLTKGMSKKSEKLDAIKSALEIGDEDALFMYYKYGSHLSDNEALTAAREALDSLDDESERKANAKAAGLTLKEYDEYHSAINKIEGIEGEDGQTISGSAYANKLSYIIKNTDDEKTAVYLAKKFAGTSDREVLAQAEKQNVLDKKFLEMYSGFKLIEGQEDEEGKTISGTKKSKQLEYIASRCTEKQAKVLLNQIASNEDQKILIDLVSATDIDLKSFASHYSGCATLTKSEDIEKYLLSINRQTSEVEQDILYLLTSKTKKEYNRRLDKMLKNIKGPKADEKWKARVMLYRE